MGSIQAASYDQVASEAQELCCAACARPATVCVCDRVIPQQTRLRVLILQHPQEQDMLLGSAGLAARCLQNSRLVVGLSWPSLAAALQEEVRAGQWAVLYPARAVADKGSKDAPDGVGQGATTATLPERLVCTNARHARQDTKGLRGIIALDGTWSQAKTLWWRNAWLLKCARLSINSTEASIYGKLRKQPKRHCLSTLEAVAEALTALGEADEVRCHMRRVFRTLIQRVRDDAGDMRKTK